MATFKIGDPVTYDSAGADRPRHGTIKNKAHQVPDRYFVRFEGESRDELVHKGWLRHGHIGKWWDDG